MKIKVDDLADVIQDELDAYAGEVRETVDAAVLRVARRCLAQIRRNSPVGRGTYRKGWTMTRVKSAGGRLTAVIYNRTRWFRTHLLENGHAKAAGGRVEGHPHVEPAAEQAEAELLDELTQELGR